MTGDSFYIVEPEGNVVPFVLSLPHTGTAIPNHLRAGYDTGLLRVLDDTDWYLEKLYDFACELGITTIYAKYSRWVIDLNREPDSTPLYDDGRLITELCPTTTFLGERIYSKKEFEPSDQEIRRRIETYYDPYHQKIDELIGDLKAEFGQVVLWDGHSIRRIVKTIRPRPFPDFILGSNDGKSASASIIETALNSLKSSFWQINHNDPFKGGFLTRTKGNPNESVHALQLEMSKDLYMSNEETSYDFEKAEKVREILKLTFKSLISLLKD